MVTITNVKLSIFASFNLTGYMREEKVTIKYNNHIVTINGESFPVIEKDDNVSFICFAPNNQDLWKFTKGTFKRLSVTETRKLILFHPEKIELLRELSIALI